MLFNSYTFIFAFLPLSLLLYHGLRRWGFARASIFALTLLSLVYYGWWNPIYLALLVPLLLANFGLAHRIVPSEVRSRPAARAWLAFGVTANLGVLGWFKYANFFVDNANTLFGSQLHLARIALPLGISFFIFQKIAFLVDVYRGKVDRLDLLDFSLFVSFFPQLIAGPIVHHSEVLPQFRQRGAVPGAYLTTGLTIFVIGLCKKALLADTLASYATPVFNAAAAGAPPGLLASWSGALAYTAQLYFDFSGYSDMAIGAALMFGIRLPVNFDSPYKAASIVDFWRRWHMTLSRFLRDYLYFPLGGNRLGGLRRYLNLMVTMLLGGLWHGAGWTFVIWGALHGFYLMLNHAWRALRPRLPLPAIASSLERRLAQALTFLAVVVGWVIFRAADLQSAKSVLGGMLGLNGAMPAFGAGDATSGILLAGASLLLAWSAPNTQELTGYVAPSGSHGGAPAPRPRGVGEMHWRPSLRWAAAIGVAFGVSALSLPRVSEFLYFQF
jgi:alginate O-acetyltransferase complex protein AlgI